MNNAEYVDINGNRVAADHPQAIFCNDLLGARQEVVRVARKAVNAGLLSKGTKCEICGATDVKLEGHHMDYSQPLLVEWVCVGCHRWFHQRIVKWRIGRRRFVFGRPRA